MRYVYMLLCAAIVMLLLFGSIRFIEIFGHICSPSITNAMYKWDGQTDPKPYVYSQTIPIEGAKYFELSMTMDVGRIRPLLWRINPDDCLEELWINDVSVQHPGIPYCEINNNNIVIYLEPYIQTGPNQIRMRIQHLSWGAGAWIGAADNDPMLLLPKLLVVLLLCLGGIWIACKKTPWCWWVIPLGTISVFLRLLYVLNTSHTERAHDVDGHLEYIRYIATNLALPPLKEGWETFQPPLYYIIGAVWYRFGMISGRAESLLTRDLQWGALCASVFVALIGIWIGWLLFPERKQRILAVLFGSVIAVFPGLIYFAARINNDVFVHFWIFLAMALALLWKRSSKMRWWYLAMFMTGLGILSKGNALLFVPVLMGALLLSSKVSWRKKSIHVIGGVLLLTILTGWFFGMRLSQGQSHIVDNMYNIDSRLAVSNDIGLFTKFNPVRMLMQPYNNVWDDSSGRQNFFEYFFRSAFYGGFNFGKSLQPLSAFLLLLALLLCIPMITGFWNAIWHNTRTSSLLWLTFLCVTGGHIGLRIIAPFVSSQDFRHSFLLLVPCTAFILQGISGMSHGWRRLYTTILITLISTCAVFVVLLATR